MIGSVYIKRQLKININIEKEIIIFSSFSSKLYTIYLTKIGLKLLVH